MKKKLRLRMPFNASVILSLQRMDAYNLFLNSILGRRKIKALFFIHYSFQNGN